MMKSASSSADQMHVRFGDLNADDFRLLREVSRIACDIETTGLDPTKDSIGTVQIANDRGDSWLVKVTDQTPDYLISLMELKFVQKIFHYAPFDLGFMQEKWGARAQNVACTKAAHRILFPDAKSHSLQFLLEQYLDVRIEKSQNIRLSDWTAPDLSEEQITYAVKDVLFLGPLLDFLFEIAQQRGLSRVLEQSFDYLPTRVETDRLGAGDVFSY